MKMSPVIFAPLTIYQLNSDAVRDVNTQMFMCDFLNVYMSVNRADALERSHCLQLGPRMRVARSAHAHYAGQGSCVSNAGCTEYRSCESDLFNETTEQVREKDLNDSFTN